jgi:hypothetical protein
MEEKEIKNQSENLVADQDDDKIFHDVKDENTGDKSLGNFKPGEYYSPNPLVDAKSTIDEIEKARDSFISLIKHYSLIRKILLVIFLSIMAGAAILLLVNQDMINKIFVPLLLVFAGFVVGILVFLAVYKKRRGLEFNHYKYEYFLNMDTYAFGQNGISNLEFSYNTSISEEIVSRLNVYDDVVKIVSRDSIKGTFTGINFLSSEVLIKTGKADQEKTQLPVFCGRFFTFNLQNSKGEAIIYLKNKGYGMPTNLTGFEVETIRGLKNDFKVWTNSKSASSLITKATVDALNEFDTDDLIDDLIIKINKSEVIIGISYSDLFMKIPYETPLPERNLLHLQKDVTKVLNFITKLQTNKNITK